MSIGRSLWRATLLAMLFTLAAGRARALDDNLDAERFKPAVTHDGWVIAEGSAVRPTQDPLELESSRRKVLT